jgi:predicted enzyme related to lactoylglutathione lyase
MSYLQIPARDVMRSAAFYEGIFGWRIERPHPEFEAPGLIGQWVSDRPAAPDAGLLAWIQVDRIDETLDLVRASGVFQKSVGWWPGGVGVSTLR